MNTKKIIASIALGASALGFANAQEMVAGWDFSQYVGSGFNILSNPAALPFTETLNANYSDRDPNGVGLESAAFGTLHYDGQFGSTDVNPDGTTDEIMPSSGSLTSNAGSSSPGITQFALANAVVSRNEGAQENALELSFASQAAVNIVFAADLSSVGGGYSDWSLTFAGVDSDNATVDVSFSTDGSSYSTAETFNLTSADAAFTTSTFGNVSDQGYFQFSFNEPGSTIDNVSISAVPEPSAFAAIFGVVALAFAANRRRRS